MSWAPGRWRASWIWTQERAAEEGRHVVELRRHLDLDEVPAAAACRVFAVSRYVLYVNGRELARGPARTGSGLGLFDELDLAPALHTGRNSIDVVAWLYHEANPWWRPLPALASDLAGGGFVLEASVGTKMLISDRSWEARPRPGWCLRDQSVFVNRGRERLDPGSAAAWRPARELDSHALGEARHGSPPSYAVGPLEPSRVSSPVVSEVELRRTGPATFAADRIVAGTISLEISGPPGRPVTFQVTEFVDGAGLPAPRPMEARFEVVAAGPARRVESLDIYGLRALGFEPSPGVEVERASVRERLHPVVGGAWFECSDPLLNRIWEVGRRTVTLCSLDAYVDCPTREQRSWTGDSVVHQMVDLTTNLDWSLARRQPALLACLRPDGMLPMAVGGDLQHHDFTVIPDCALHWIHSVWLLYRYAGVPDEIASLLPAVESVLRWFLPFRDARGTPVDVTGWLLIDWAWIETAGPSAPLAGLWGRSLLEFAEMCGWLGDRGRARWALEVHAALAAGFERFWDPVRRRYRDSDGAGATPAASQHAQAAAIVGRLAPPERWGRLVEVLTDEESLVHAAFAAPSGPAAPGSELEVAGDFLHRREMAPWWELDRQLVRAQPFFRYVVHEALAAARRADLIATLCRDWDWLLRRCDGTWGETWYGGTHCHGWSSSPTADLMTYVLGITPAEPGFGKVRVDPHLGGLDWARGAVPSPAGLIEIEVTGDSVNVRSPVPVVSSAGEKTPVDQER